ncbi:STM4013/SEN3800 family hydrolase [Fulvivirga sediminis]|uniref:STM4013/SEN3800 family hydrolase n=1 Tax=Fulvivirga sediminis TaxID=2803949 RepID=A0A937F8Q1_9BACT|nr:STM4013/SEN3800 family hydrolase [Fulvivirga sediminis]MBL3656344.1 STM4013/SEN3800 family hydrolase [Fulvivirga sediminis]
MFEGTDIVGKKSIVLITLDTLRYDVAQQLFLDGETPNLAKMLPASGWEKRHAPGSFTYASHHAFFAGFLPTPADNPKAPRLFAAKFAGSETATKGTYVFETSNIVKGLEEVGYHTICIGGVGFFNKQTALSRQFPGMFQKSHWQPSFGVTDPESTENQFEKAADCLSGLSDDQHFFLFINISAIHQPNHFYLTDTEEDTRASHAAALKYVDSQLPLLFASLKQKGETFCIFCSDHGTTYGEEGYSGHRLAHKHVWEVPYAEFLVK